MELRVRTSSSRKNMEMNVEKDKESSSRKEMEMNVEKDKEKVNEEEEEEEEEPLTPAGRMFFQPRMSCSIITIMEFEHPLDVPAIKDVLIHTLLRHKRFSSILKSDKHGRERWIKASVDIDDHVITASTSCTSAEYAGNLAIAPALDRSKPLWELHILNYSCIFRIHHALGDGTSLMSLFLACTRRVDNPQLLPSIPTTPIQRTRTNPIRFLWKILLILWHSIIEITRFLTVSLLFKDVMTPIKGSAGVEHLPKRIVSVEFPLEDMKTVKKAINGTINDVLLGIISAGLTRYLESRTGSKAVRSFKIHASGLVNTRKSPGLQDLSEMMKGGSQARWGNHMGYIILPMSIIHYDDPLDYVRHAKKVSDSKKLSLEAPLTYLSGKFVMKLAGAKFAADMIYKALVHSTFSVSNVMGPQEQVMFAGNPITSIIPTVVGQPQALCIHMQSYMGKVTLVATATVDIIPDPHLLLECCQYALHQMTIKLTTTQSTH